MLIGYPIFGRDEGVVVNSGSVVSLDAADVFGSQVSEERVMRSVLQ